MKGPIETFYPMLPIKVSQDGIRVVYVRFILDSDTQPEWVLQDGRITLSFIISILQSDPPVVTSTASTIALSFYFYTHFEPKTFDPRHASVLTARFSACWNLTAFLYVAFSIISASIVLKCG